MRTIDADRLKKSFEANTPIAFQDCVHGIHAIIDLEPTVEAEPKWISVTERLPEDDRWRQIIVTLDPSYGDGKHMDSRCAYFTHGSFYSCESHGVYMKGSVKAWMELPKPYEGKEE